MRLGAPFLVHHQGDVPTVKTLSRSTMVLLTAAIQIALSSCGSGVDDTWMPIDGASCHARTRRYERLSSPHVDPNIAPITWNSNPPSSGPHSSVWARFGVFRTPVPRANYVHNLEHGGVVIAYRCADDQCPLAAPVRALFERLPADPACVSPGAPRRPRAVITPDPGLESDIAAVAWGVVYEANCVDSASLIGFYQANVGNGPEDTCADGGYQ